MKPFLTAAMAVGLSPDAERGMREEKQGFVAAARARLVVQVGVQVAAQQQVEQRLRAVLVVPQHRRAVQAQQLAARQPPNQATC